MYELKENKPLNLEIGIVSEIFDKTNSKTSMLAYLVMCSVNESDSFLDVS